MLNINPDTAEIIIRWISTDGVLLAFCAFAFPALAYLCWAFLIDPEAWAE